MTIRNNFKLTLPARLFVLVIIIPLLLSGCYSADETKTMDPSNSASTTGSKMVTIDWTMQGTWISLDGTVGDTVEFSISGAIPSVQSSTEQFSLDIVFPDDFRYSYVDADGGDYVSVSRNNIPPYFVCPSYCYDKEKDEALFSYFALCAEKQYVIFSWEKHPGQYLVAAADSNTDAAVILEYFKEFVDTFAYKD